MPLDPNDPRPMYIQEPHDPEEQKPNYGYNPPLQAHRPPPQPPAQAAPYDPRLDHLWNGRGREVRQEARPVTVRAWFVGVGFTLLIISLFATFAAESALQAAFDNIGDGGSTEPSWWVSNGAKLARVCEVIGVGVLILGVYVRPSWEVE